MSSAPQPIVPSVNQWNAEYLEQQYRVYKDHPEQLDAATLAFFQGFDLAQASDLRLFGSSQSAPVSQASAPIGPTKVTPTIGRPAGKASHFEAIVDDFIGAYRDQGHLCAKIDPFGRERERPASLSLAYHGLTEADLQRMVDGSSMGLPSQVPLGKVIDYLEQMYCSAIGVEFMHVADTEQRAWLLERFETIGGKLSLEKQQKTSILEQLTRSESFEKFLGRRYPGEKRFSLEGAESLIPLLDHMIESFSNLGVEEVVLGMAHRGRLNVLHNTIGKTLEQIFTEFEENWSEGFADGGGDVKYHRGYSGTRRLNNGRMVHLALASNPSHLEAVNGVVEGRCRAKQRLRGDANRERVTPVLIHGDAAIIGQGVVQEVLNFSQLEGYTTGGTVHVVVNNQIGFTTLPEDGRSSRYCTDIGKLIDAPIFHVNGEDPEAVVTVAQLAAEYRQKFKRDVFIDLLCYRRYGHNEQDETSFTQPIMADKIKKKPSILKIYTEKLLAEQVINEADRQSIVSRLSEALEKAQQAAQETPNDPTIDPGSARWDGLTHKFSYSPVDTSVSKEQIEEVAKAIGSVPEGFNLNPKLKKLLEERGNLPSADLISYADAEQLAYGTLLAEGHPVRLSGQDCRRGTFSHRHAVIRDFESGEPYTPLNSIREVGTEGTATPPGSEGSDGKPRQAKFCVYDSPLSEEGVLGFEYGYSLGDPGMLIIWEAQFGDFYNGAQAIVDQFIASAEIKWDRWSGLTMLLPHGYEGAGPEHSSARLERFLQLCGNDNMFVVYPSTASQTFHMLRRQVKAQYRKPLVVMTPKSYLRIPTSPLSELVDGRFHEILDDPRFEQDGWDRSKVKRVIYCVGKVYHELDERRVARDQRDTAILRVEQMYPLHTELLKELDERYPEKAERVFVQEETYNAGAYQFLVDMIETKLGWQRWQYIGRQRSSTPATGSKSQHKIEQEQILTKAIGPKPESDPKKNKKVAAARA
ncbi:MAG: 2-oxoglutarate dehydrogenase E1 component [Phycisphaerae bacterium]|nr:2-oxoglutarate dehydrogenase E1 component [Phycisphaerae bacterium]MBM91530.1 2-oxoglutarate dehydrogenase E1 component [Phycisphaerae bacterium]